MKRNELETLLNEIEIKEQVHGLITPKHTPEAKYKKPSNHKLSRPNLKVGTKLIWPLTKGWYMYGDIRGYALGIVLDWGTNGKPEDSDVHYWQSGSQCVVQIIKVSNKDYEWLVGHLRSITLYSWSKPMEMPIFCPEEGAAKDYGL